MNPDQNNPKISIISPSFNTGRFARETIESILAQSYTGWEHIVVDGGSTDGTIDILKSYPHLRWLSEKDSGPEEAFRKGLAMAKGDYVMFCGISDGYLDKNWFKKCTDVLDNNPEVSLVWGLPQYMLEDGRLHRISYDYFFDNPPPQGKDFIYFWLKSYLHFPEGNFCVRRTVMDDCFPVVDPKNIGHECEFMTFNSNFNIRGYLPHFIPVVANYGRIHGDALGQKQLSSGKRFIWNREYRNAAKEYRNKLLLGKVVHNYRDGNGRLISGGLNLRKI